MKENSTQPDRVEAPSPKVNNSPQDTPKPMLKNGSASNLFRNIKSQRGRAFSSDLIERRRADSYLAQPDSRFIKAFSEGDVSRLINDDSPRAYQGQSPTSTPRRRTQDHINASSDTVDRSSWSRDVQRANPLVKEMRERMKPLNRAVAFAKLYNPGRKQVKDGWTGEFTIRLIMQHLQVTGFHSTLKAMEQEAGITLASETQLINESRLCLFLKRAIKDTERVYDLATGEKEIVGFSPPATVFATLSPSQSQANINNNNNANSNNNSNILSDLVSPEDNNNNNNNNSNTDTDNTDTDNCSTIDTDNETNDSSSLSPFSFIYTQLEEHLYDLGLIEDDQRDEDHVDIWAQKEDEYLVEEAAQEVTTRDEDDITVKAGTLNKLVEKLTSEHKHDLNFVKTFLMTYQSFATPQTLLTKLIQRYNVPPSFQANHEERASIVRRIRLRVCSVLQKWVADYFSDFDEDLKMQLKSFIHHMRTTGEPALASAIHSVLSKKEYPGKTEKLAYSLPDKMPEPNVPRNIFSGTLDFYDLDEEEIARQLTLIEFDIFARVKPCELLNQAWSKPKLKHRAQNMLAMIDRFNAVSNWVGTLIVTSAKIKNRIKALTRFIKIGKHLRTLNNFNSLMAIIAGLNYAAIHRMRFTWESLPTNIQEMYTEIEKVMSSEGAFKTYRDCLKAASIGASIPYLGVHLTDLVFIDENPDFVSYKGIELINVSKRKLIYNTITQIQQLQHTPYNLQPVYQIAMFLKDLPCIDEQKMYNLSLMREPRKAKISDIQ